MSRLILAIDQGTTSSRAMLFSADMTCIGTTQKELELIYPQNGWVEQDATVIRQDVLELCRAVLAEHNAASTDVAAIGITNQRETVVVWDKADGKPVYNAIVWQDRRTSEFCNKLKERGQEPEIQEKTGLVIDPYFSASKVKWILDNVDGAREKADRGELLFGTIDSWLVWTLTGGASHVTDATNASRTMLYNIRTGDWDDELLKIFDIPRVMLPKVKDNVDDFGVTAEGIFDAPLPIKGIAGDQQAALIGQACFSPGMVKSTYGTGCFALMNIGETFKVSQNRLLTTIAYRMNGKVTYALEGSIFIAGAAVQWLRDELKIIETAEESETLARGLDDNGGVYLVPAFTGLGAPYWRSDARAVITGLTRDSGRAHIARAALEAQAYQTRDLVEAMTKDSGQPLKDMRVDGGMVANDWMCQFLADMTDVAAARPPVIETTALGAGFLAAIGAGIYDSFDDISAHWSGEAHFSPNMEEAEREKLWLGWQKAVKSCLL